MPTSARSSPGSCWNHTKRSGGWASLNEERAALERLRETGEAIIDGVERCVPVWARVQVTRTLDAWGHVEPSARARADERARAAGHAAATRVTAELRSLFDLDPAEQRCTPLEIVRSAIQEPTEVLRATGIPPVERDQFDERAFPDDRYGLVPRTLADFGDETLAPLHLQWGMAKAAVLRARSEQH
jgi:hypothetical protein